MNKTLILCPVDDCYWTLDATPPEIPQGALADVFGFGVFAASAAYSHSANIERQIEEHLRTHPLRAFVDTIQRLRRECGEDDALRAALKTLPVQP